MLTDAELREALGAPEPEPNGIAAALAKVPVLNDERPILDFENLSWADSKRVPIIQSKVKKAADSDDIDQLTQLMGELETILSHIVLFIPKSWLVREAPDNLSWGDAASFGFLKGHKFQELVQIAMQGNQEVAENSKN